VVLTAKNAKGAKDGGVRVTARTIHLLRNVVVSFFAFPLRRVYFAVKHAVATDYHA
jgi:hypothetical protein